MNGGWSSWGVRIHPFLDPPTPHHAQHGQCNLCTQTNGSRRCQTHGGKCPRPRRRRLRQRLQQHSRFGQSDEPHGPAASAARGAKQPPCGQSAVKHMCRAARPSAPLWGPTRRSRQPRRPPSRHLWSATAHIPHPTSHIMSKWAGPHGQAGYGGAEAGGWQFSGCDSAWAL